jgi:hypothetical protein
MITAEGAESTEPDACSKERKCATIRKTTTKRPERVQQNDRERGYRIDESDS